MIETDRPTWFLLRSLNRPNVDPNRSDDARPQIVRSHFPRGQLELRRLFESRDFLGHILSAVLKYIRTHFSGSVPDLRKDLLQAEIRAGEREVRADRRLKEPLAR